MLIEIDGYRNIQDLKYEIVDERINFLFGVSGSGKSSIAMAMCAEEMEFNKKVDYIGETKVQINGVEVEEDKVMIFSSSSVDKYLTFSDNDSVFNILIDDENELAIEQDKFDKYMLRFRLTIDQYKGLYNQLRDVSTNLVGTLTNKDAIRSTAKIKQLEKNFSGKNNTRIVNEINGMESNELEWIIQGNSLIKDNLCPFCLKKVSKKRILKINKYAEYDIKNLRIVREKSSNFSAVGISKLKYTATGVSKLSDEMRKAAIAVKEFEKIMNYLVSIDDEKKDEKSIAQIVVKQELYGYFPNIRKIISGLNENIDSINEKTTSLRSKTKEVLSRKVKGVNEKIELLGIPYQIEIQYKKNKIKSYKLKLAKDLKEDDRKKSLSNGERNLIAFLIFALDVNKNGKNKLCIIDDPVSSYDEHRRKLIYEYIKEVLGKRTILILSHDSVFARIATNDNTKNTIGSINYFENTDGTVRLIEITNDDFKKFDDFLLNRINNSNDYYQKVINLRMIYEGHYGYVYTYLSNILHFKSQEKNANWLKTKKRNEEDILKEIKNEKKVELIKYEDSFLANLNLSKYSLMEKAAFVRIRGKNLPSGIKNELNHIMHVGDRHVVCLDPHKYSFCSNITRKEIDNQLNHISLNLKLT